MDHNCPFCQIIAGERPGRIVYRDETITAFWDHAPIAPVHILIVPNEHIVSLNDVTEDQQKLLGHLLLAARKIAQDQGVHDNGYRLLLNTGANGGQTVFHLHLHLIGGKRFPLDMATR